MFFIFMTLCNCLIPLVMLISGYVMLKHCPKEINSFFGYRTRRSMTNRDTWKFAHKYCGKVWVVFGTAMIIPSAVALIPFANASDDVIGNVSLVICAVQIVLLVLSVIPTEIALARTFDDDGNRLK